MTDLPRQEVLNAKIAMITQASIGISFLSVVATLQFIALREKLPKMRICARRTDRTLLWMIGVILCALSFFIIEMSTYAANWTYNPAGCHLAGAPFIPIAYVITKQFLYFFLFERSCIVHDSLKLQEKQFITFRTFVGLCIVFGIP